jgi:hypothetical protein
MRFRDAIDIRFSELGGIETIGLLDRYRALSRASRQQGHEKQEQEQFTHGQ